ncbi:MAG TPA: VWA domain-containing protein [Thermoanaerobaculia bacterium]|nr:VWA domain-containing protein [Thermoanaerobaculia bacterium]
MAIRRLLCGVVCFAFLLLHPSVLRAQEGAPFVEVLEVGLTNVDVVATGKDGQPVTGLKPADFEVFEDGKPQPITNFSEIGGQGASAILMAEGGTQQAEPAAVPARKFIFYVDDSNLNLQNRRTIFPAIQKFLAANVRTGDRAMLVSWNRELKVRVAWTTDLAAINAALEAMSGEVSGGSALHTQKQQAERLMTKMEEEANEPNNNMKPLWSELENAARNYAENAKIDFTQSTNALVRLLASLPGVDGKKVLVMATESLPTMAGAELFEHMENIRSAAMSNPASAWRGEASAGSRVTDLSRYNLQPTLEVLIRAANASGVTVYGINPKGLGGPASGKTEQQMYRESNIDFAGSDQQLAGINMLANRTGGVALIGAPADMALDRVGRDLNAYYSLGYKSTKGTSPERKIEVRSKRPGVQVRTRANVYYRSLEREMADRVVANQLQSELANGLGIALEADPVTTDGSRQLLPVRVIIPVSMLTLLPDGKGGVSGGFSVFTCSADGAGGTSGVNVQSQALNFTAEQAAQMKNRRIGFAIQVPLEKGRDKISVGVLDHISHEQGFATLKAAL